jgi:hypothetical protein
MLHAKQETETQNSEHARPTRFSNRIKYELEAFVRPTLHGKAPEWPPEKTGLLRVVLSGQVWYSLPGSVAFAPDLPLQIPIILPA